jgi:uncharacterized membrane protein YcaP (DUF421 family)
MGVAWFSGWDVIVRTLVAGSVTYLALVLLLRVSGPRTLAKWYAFDLIVTVALGSTFANGVLSKDIAVAQAVAGFVFLVALQYIIGTLAVHSPRVLRVVNPAPVLLLVDGKMQEDAMRKNRVTRADISKALRSSGMASIEDAGAIVLEPDGTFSVLGRFDKKNVSALQDVPGFDELLHGGKREASKDAGEKGAMV